MLPSELAEIYGPLVRVGPIHAPGGPHPSVQRLLFADGTHVIAKRYLFYPMTAGHPHDLLETESEVTRQLSEAGCRTPAVLATDPAQGIIYFEYVPGPTLDDAMQTSDPVTRARLADRVVDAFVAMQETFVNAEDTLEHRVAPGTDPETVRSNFVDAVVGMGFPVGTNAVDLARELATHPLQLGPTDYNARNILITNDDTPCFIDLGKVGYDWPERRLVRRCWCGRADRRGAAARGGGLARQGARGGARERGRVVGRRCARAAARRRGGGGLARPCREQPVWARVAGADLSPRDCDGCRGG